MRGFGLSGSFLSGRIVLPPTKAQLEARGLGPRLESLSQTSYHTTPDPSGRRDSSPWRKSLQAQANSHSGTPHSLLMSSKNQTRPSMTANVDKSRATT